MQEALVQSLVGELKSYMPQVMAKKKEIGRTNRNWQVYYQSRRRQWHPTPVLLPGKSMDGGAWCASVHGVAKSQTQLSDFTFTFHLHALEKEMATHSNVLAWGIPGTGEAWWAAVYGVAQRWTRLKRLSSSSTWLWVKDCQGLLCLVHLWFFRVQSRTCYIVSTH